MKRQKFIVLSKTEFEHLFSNASFNVGYFEATMNELRKMLGKKYTRGGDKVNVTWEIMLEDKTYFRIYDYKYYGKNSPLLNPNETITWSIGSHDKESGLKAMLFLEQLKKEKELENE